VPCLPRCSRRPKVRGRLPGAPDRRIDRPDLPESGAIHRSRTVPARDADRLAADVARRFRCSAGRVTRLGNPVTGPTGHSRHTALSRSLPLGPTGRAVGHAACAARQRPGRATPPRGGARLSAACSACPSGYAPDVFLGSARHGGNSPSPWRSGSVVLVKAALRQAALRRPPQARPDVKAVERLSTRTQRRRLLQTVQSIEGDVHMLAIMRVTGGCLRTRGLRTFSMDKPGPRRSRARPPPPGSSPARRLRRSSGRVHGAGRKREQRQFRIKAAWSRATGATQPAPRRGINHLPSGESRRPAAQGR
jgi:hypothetical protein